MRSHEHIGTEAVPESYSLERTTVGAITEVRPMLGKMSEFEWPLELQGKGTTNERDKTMEVRFPKGDIFLSYVTTIHELGHLRQEELNPLLKAEPQTHEVLVAQEQDAWVRGWQRFLQTNSDLVGILEQRFAAHKEQGTIEFNSFADLYAWVQENVLKMVEVQRVLFEGSGKTDEEKMDALADGLKGLNIEGFLSHYKAVQVGEIVDEEEIRQAICDTIEHVIRE